MAGKPLLSVIVYNYNWEETIKTLDSLTAQEGMTADSLEIRIVTKEQDNSPQLTSWIQEHGGQALLVSSRPGCIEKAEGTCTGTFLCLTQSGIVYHNTMLGKLKASYEEKGERLCLMAVSSKDSDNHAKQINRFHRTAVKNKTGLLEDSRLYHYCFFAFLLPRAGLRREWEGFSHPYMEMWAFLYKQITYTEHIRCLEKCACKVTPNCTHRDFWQEITKDDSFAKEFRMKFLEGLWTWTIRNEKCIKENGVYNLFHYLALYAINRGKRETQVQEEEKQWALEYLERLECPHLIGSDSFLPRAFKNYLLKKKGYISDCSQEIQDKMAKVLDQSQFPVKIHYLSLEKHALRIEGSAITYEPGDSVGYFSGGKNIYPCTEKEWGTARYWFGECVERELFFQCRISYSQITDGAKFHFFFKKDGKKEERPNLTFGMFAPLSDECFLFTEDNGWFLYYTEEDSAIVLEKASFFRRKELQKIQDNSLKQVGSDGEEAAAVQGEYRKYFRLPRKKIWLISDRTFLADDNGEALWSYLAQHPVKGVKPYFVLQKDSEDYERVRKLGEVVEPLSREHRFLHLLSDCIFSSQMNEPVFNPFGAEREYYKNILAQKRIIFLGHGLLQGDLFQWLNHYKRNLYAMITTTPQETEAVITKGGFTKEQVWQVGMCRFDLLYHDEEKVITIMPTWRQKLCSSRNVSTGQWFMGEDFESSEFYEFFNGLLNHPRLLEKAREYGYQLWFRPHPLFYPAISKFTANPQVRFVEESMAYRDIFAKTSLLVTDYSSAAFDFSYLHKPVVYCQFDREDFLGGSHTVKKGHFDHYRDGFGEVTRNLEDTVDMIISYIEDDCTLKPKYEKRIDETFPFKDSNCRARLVSRLTKTPSY